VLYGILLNYIKILSYVIIMLKQQSQTSNNILNYILKCFHSISFNIFEKSQKKYEKEYFLKAPRLKPQPSKIEPPFLKI